jgi:creatinine amidohydrolase
VDDQTTNPRWGQAAASTRFDTLTRDDVRQLAPNATVVVPLGSIEQHGPHLPVQTDTTIVTALAERAVELAARQVPVVVTPTLPVGFAHHHLSFGGTLSLGLTTYLDVITSLGESLAVGGFTRIVFLNGHGGNDASIRAVGDRLVTERGYDIQVAGTSYWTCAADALAELDPRIGPMPGHAGSFETSCMLALRPELVRTDRMPLPENDLQPLAKIAMPGAAVRRAHAWTVSVGRTDDARYASAALGERILDTVSARIADFIVAFHRAPALVASANDVTREADAATA